MDQPEQATDSLDSGTYPASELAPDWLRLPGNVWRLTALHLDRPSLAPWLRSTSFFAASIRPATAFHEEWHHMRYRPDPMMQVGCLQAPTISWQHAPVYALAVSPDGCTAICRAAGPDLQVWDLQSGTCKAVLCGHKKFVAAVVLLEGGMAAVSCSGDKTLRVWDLHSFTCTATWTGHTGEVHCLAALPGGTAWCERVVSGGLDGTLRLWQLASGTCTAVLQGDPHETFESVAVLGASIVLAVSSNHVQLGTRCKTPKIWDLQTGACTAVLGHVKSQCSCMAVTPDLHFMVLAAGETVVHV